MTADHATFTACDYRTGRLFAYSDDLDYLVADCWLSQYQAWSTTAIAWCAEPRAATKTPRFKIEMRDAPKHMAPNDARLICLCLEAGNYDLAHIYFTGAKPHEVIAAFERRKITLETHGLAFWKKPQPIEQGYAA